MNRIIVGFALVLLGCGFIIGNVEQIEFSILGAITFFVGVVLLPIGALQQDRNICF